MTARAAAELLRTDGAEVVDRLATHRRYATQSLGRLMAARIEFSLVAQSVLGECSDVQALTAAAERWNHAALDLDEALTLSEVDTVRLIDITKVATDAVLRAELAEREREDAARSPEERAMLSRLSGSPASGPVGGA